jgi:hypothetical protein
MTFDLFNKLDDEARKKGRTLSAEAEYRLEASFERDQAFDVAYGPKAAALLMVIARAVNDVGKSAEFRASSTGAARVDWTSNLTAFNEVRSAINEVLAAFEPDPPAEEIFDYAPHLAQLGIDVPPSWLGLTRGLLAAVKRPEGHGSIDIWAQPIHDRLGEAAAKLKVDAMPPVLMLSANLRGGSGQ